MQTTTIQNWDGTRTWTPDAVFYPESEEEVSRHLKEAAEHRNKIKPIGEALSWSDVSDMPSCALRFDRMNKVLDVDAENRLVRVQAGARLRDVNEALAVHGLAFDNFGSIILQTAGGYIGTGTHGTGARTPILSSFIERMKLVDGQGSVHELDRDREPELFSAARVNLGCLGAVTEITFRCVDAFDLEEQLELVDFDAALADLDSFINDNDYCKFWWLPYTDKIQVYKFNRSTRPRGGFGFTGFMDRTGLSGHLFTGLMKLGRAVPVAIPLLHHTVQNIHFHPRRRVDRSDKVIKVSNVIPKHQETEYAIPLGQAARAIDETRKLVLKADYRVNFPLEVRFVAADDIPMSPASGRDSCYIGAYVGSLDWSPPYFAEFEDIMRDFDGRPHWGKTFSLTHNELKSLYPAYDSFNQLRQECDPQGVFQNSFVDRVFPER